MKTPREILLNRHASAGEKLDTIRERVLASECEAKTRNAKRETQNLRALPLRALMTLGRELIWPARRIWSGLAAVWVALAIFHFAQAGGREAMAANSTVPPAQMRLAFQEQQRLLAEILGPTQTAVPAEPPRRNPQPRSERQTNWRISTVGDEVTSLKYLCA